jgi:glucose-6-phosphate-specific signal transduction histidine kinase
MTWPAVAGLIVCAAICTILGIALGISIEKITRHEQEKAKEQAHNRSHLN